MRPRALKSSDRCQLRVKCDQPGRPDCALIARCRGFEAVICNLHYILVPIQRKNDSLAENLLASRWKRAYTGGCFPPGCKCVRIPGSGFRRYGMIDKLKVLVVVLCMLDR